MVAKVNNYTYTVIANTSADFIGVQSMPYTTGNLIKSQVEEGNLNGSDVSLAFSSILNGVTAFYTHFVRNAMWVNKALPYTGLAISVEALAFDLIKLNDEIKLDRNNDGELDYRVSNETLLAIGSDITGMAASLTSMYAMGVGVRAGSVAIPLAVASVAFAAMSISSTKDISYNEALIVASDNLLNNTHQLLSIANNEFDEAITLIINSPSFYNDMLNQLGNGFLDIFLPDSITNIDPRINASFVASTVGTNITQRLYDPIAFDLDGDGFETIGIKEGIKFDHNGDGIKTATGWLSGDDGFLVRDLNGNGVIDSGKELFGDNTINSSGQTSFNGFSALYNIDANRDGKIDINDPAFSQLQIWRDLNSDGISQSDELFSLESQGIAAINTGITSNQRIDLESTNNTELFRTLNLQGISGANVNIATRAYMGNINQVNWFGSYIKTDGTTSSNAAMADLLFSSNNSDTDFQNEITINPAVANLPNVQGSGAVRDLQQAATLSDSLASLLTQFKSLTTHDAQMALMDGVLKTWANTSTMKASASGAYDGHPLTLDFRGLVSGSEAQSLMLSKLDILEKFNGQTVYNIPNGTAAQTLTLIADSQIFLNRSYDLLKADVFNTLTMQTRLEPLLDKIGMNITANGIKLDFTALTAEFNARISQNTREGLLDLINFNVATKDKLAGTGWDGWSLLNDYSNQTAILQEASNTLILGNVYINGINGFNTASSGETLGFNDVILGSAINERIQAGGGNDIIFGGAGNDTIFGAAGNDTITGGTGFDHLYGGLGNNTYIFGRGDGADYIYSETGQVADRVNVLSFKPGISPSDISFSLSATALTISISNSTDKIIVNNFSNGNGLLNPLQEIHFNNGVIWDVGQITNLVLTGTAINDQLTGYDLNDTITGNDGHDTLNGADGHDFLLGGNGNDRLYGMTGNDISIGGAGDDTLSESTGNNLLFGGDGNDSLQGAYIPTYDPTHPLNYIGNELMIGGRGNDIISTGDGYDVIAFNKGDGQDTVAYSVGLNNTLSLGGGIEYTDLSLSKAGDNLVLNIGATDKITLANWYSPKMNYVPTDARSVVDMQVIAEAMSQFDLGGTNPLMDNKVEHFDFAGLVSQFNAEGSQNNWQLTDARLLAHLELGSNTDIIGGEAAYHYGATGNINIISPVGLFNNLNSPDFSINQQAFHPANAGDIWVL